MICIKRDGLADIVSSLNEPTGNLKAVSCPEPGEHVNVLSHREGFGYRIEGYDKDSDGGSIYHDPRCFVLPRRLESIINQEEKELCN